MQYLKSLHLNKIMEKESCDVNEGLEKLYDIIKKFASQEHKSHRYPEAKVGYLYEAIIFIDWAENGLTNAYSSTSP